MAHSQIAVSDALGGAWATGSEVYPPAAPGGPETHPLGAGVVKSH